MTNGYFGLPTSYTEYSSDPNFLKPNIRSLVFRLSNDLSEAQEIRSRIEKDPRLQDYIHPYVVGETKELRLQVQNLVAWWVWRANSTDKATADSELEAFISTIDDDKEHVGALWVYGLSCQESVSLTDGVQVTPLSEMPLSDEKLRFANIVPEVRYQNKPLAALTCKYEYNMSERMRSAKAASIVAEKLKEIASVLNCLNGCICVPAFSSSYAPEGVPPGFFGGGGGQYWTEQAIPRQVYELPEDCKLPLVGELIAKFSALPEKYRTQFRAALERFSQAKSTQDGRKMALDMGVSLEMLLTYSENKKEFPDQLSLAFRMRGAWLAGENRDDRKHIFKTLNNIYSHRSQVAHRGEIDYKDADQAEIAEMKKDHIEVAERVFQCLIRHGKVPVWNEMILGGFVPE